MRTVFTAPNIDFDHCWRRAARAVANDGSGPLFSLVETVRPERGSQRKNWPSLRV